MLTTINCDNGSRVLSYASVTPELEIKLKELMTQAAVFNKTYNAVRDSIPEGYYPQFFGNWDFLVIKELDDVGDFLDS